MRVALVFPPSLCLPNVLYHALPVLAGALRRAGHEPRIHDLNLAAADLFLTEERVERYLGMGRTRVLQLRRSERPELASDTADLLERNLDAAEPALRFGPEAKAILRDPVRFFEPPAFKRAFWTVVDALAFQNQLDPILSPHRPTFARDLVDYQEQDPWTPLVDLYAEALLSEALEGDPGLVAITIAFPEQACEAVRFARRVRALQPGVRIAFGGPLVTAFAERWLEGDLLLRYGDYVCIGDGEDTIALLADAIARGGDLAAIPNLAYRDPRGTVRRPAGPPRLTRMDDVPVPDFSGADMQRGFTPRPIYPLMLSRGCYWGRCTFCSIGWRENYRVASPEKIAADARDLALSQGARYVQLQDSSLPPRAALELAAAVREDFPVLRWVAGMKFEKHLLDPGFAAALHAGGCRSLLLGFESATQRLVDAMDKGFQVGDVPAMLDNLRVAGISAELLWFVGFPSETRQEALDTVRWLAERRDRFGLSAFVSEYQLHPDTIIHDRPADFGLTVTGQDNGVCSYRAESGMQIDELAALKSELQSSNNRTLVCNASHLPHVVESGLDLSRIARPLEVTQRVLEFAAAAPARASGFYDGDFGFRSALEAGWHEVRAEWERLPRAEPRAWPQHGAYDGKWHVFSFYIMGRRIERNCRFCPETTRLIERVPGLMTAGFSILGPRTRLPLHRGEGPHVLRGHLGVVVPPNCAIRLSGELRTWQEGKTLVFDDTLPHEAWNASDQEKVVLLIDFRKPRSLIEGGPLDAAALAEYDERAERFFRALFPDWV